jgi:hypothetical protein
MFLTVYAGLAPLQVPCLAVCQFPAAYALGDAPLLVGLPLLDRWASQIVWPVTWAKQALVSKVQSAALAIKRPTVIMVSPPVSFLLPALALPGLCGKKPHVASMFRATFCQSDGRNQMHWKNAASVMCGGGSAAAYP